MRRGAAVEPSGDVLEADVARESADDVVAALDALDSGSAGRPWTAATESTPWS